MLLLAFVFAAALFVTGAMAAHLPASSSAAARRRSRRSPLRPWSGPRKSRRVSSSSSCCAGAIRLFRRGLRRSCIRSAPVCSRSRSRGAVPFAIFYGAGNGLLTIACGTVPLAVRSACYGERTGLLGAPARASQALAPLLFGLLGPMGAAVIVVSAGLCAASFAALFAFFLRARPSFHPPPPPPPRIVPADFTMMRQKKRPGERPGRLIFT